MGLPFEAMVALRHLRSRRKSAFVSLITVISVLGIALGVATLITVLGVMSGYTGYMKERILGATAHLLVQGGPDGMPDYQETAERVREEKGVLAASPYVMGQALVKLEGSVSGVVVRGVDPSREGGVNDLGRNMAQGRLEDLRGDGILVGVELIRSQGLKVGDKVTLISPSEVSSPFGMVPLMKTFTVQGVFDTGMYEYDTGLVLVTMAAAQDLYDMGDLATGVAARVEDVYATGPLKARLEADLGWPYWVRDWKDMNQNLFSALKLEKITMFVILILIILVAAFNIVGTQIMVVMEKGKEIAILMAMGARRAAVGRIFLLEGLIVGLTGTVLGVLLGLSLCWALAKYHFVELPASVYYVSTIPVRVYPFDVALICLSALAISFFATLYPARRASALDPVEILRYE